MNRSRIDVWTLLAALPFAAICLGYLDFIPIWDSREYAECIEAAARSRVFADYACANHPSIAYVAITSILSQFIHGRYWPILVANLGLGLFGLFQYCALIREVFPDRPLDARLLTLALAVFPVFLSSGVSVNPDFGVTIFLIAVVRALLGNRFIAAAVYGLLLCFCKEPGVALLGAVVALHAIFFVTRAEGTVREKLRRLWRYSIPLIAIPILGAWLVLRPHKPASLIWGNVKPFDLVATLFSFSLLDKVFDAQLASIFLFQFTWALSLACAVRWGRKLWARLFKLPLTDPPVLRYLDWVLFASVFILTRPRTFVNVRYFLPVIPFLLLSAYLSIRALPQTARAALIAVVSAAFLVSAFRTVDPIAKRTTGTFQFGSHPMLAVTNLTGECCGLGRDQLAYNLEHTELHYLQDQIYSELRPHPLELSGPAMAEWYLIGNLDAQGYWRTLQTEGTLRLHLVDPRAIVAGTRPPKLYWIRFPNFRNGHEQEEHMLRWYRPTERRKFAHDGYLLDVDVLERIDGSAGSH